MIRFLVLLLILVAAVVIQTTLADLASVGPARPDVVIALAVYLALAFELREVFIPIWAMGIMRDVFSAAPVGMHGLIFLGLGLLVSHIRHYVPRDNPIVMMFVAAVAVVLCETVAVGVLAMKYGAHVQSSVLVNTLLNAAYTAVVSAVLPRFLNRPCRWVGMGKIENQF